MKKEQNFAKALKELRKSKNLTLDQISKSSNIKKKYLENIENGNFSFKPEIYINLFLREYIRHIDLNQVDSITQEFEQIFYKSKLEHNKPDLEITPTSDTDEEFQEFNSFDSHSYNPKIIASIIATIIIIILFYKTISNYFLV